MRDTSMQMTKISLFKKQGILVILVIKGIMEVMVILLLAVLHHLREKKNTFSNNTD